MLMLITKIVTPSFTVNETLVGESEIYHAKAHLVRTDSPKTTTHPPNLHSTLRNSFNFK